MARKVMSDGSWCGYEHYTTDYGGDCGHMHFPSFVLPACLCCIPDCPCRDITIWKERNPTMTRYRIRKLRALIKLVEQRWMS